MATGRTPKRARKKDRRAARREAYMQEYLRRRRQRRVAGLGILTAVVVALVVIAVVAHPFGVLKAKKAAAPTPKASVAPLPAANKNVVACGGKVPAAASEKKQTYSQADDEGLDPNTKYTWKLQTSCGEVDVGLDVKDSPKITNSIVFLTKSGFFDGLLFHRIAPNFVIQGGDPKGDGTGGPGYKVVDPIPPGFKYQKGVVAMAKSQAESSGTSGSQFFIVSSEQAEAALTPDYGILGLVTSGMDVVDKIAATGTTDGAPPKAYTYIEKATIVEG